MASDIAVTAENYGGHPDDGPNVIVVTVGGVEVGAYCIVDHPEQERLAMLALVNAVRDAGAERMRERAAARALACLGDEDDPSGGPMDGYDRWDAVHYVVEKIRALPLTEPDDA